MEDTKKRNTGIDIIKALSMIAVVIYHFYEFKGTYMGVLLFFVISGYFITSSLLEKTETYLEFLYKRLMRIYPTLLGVLAFSLLMFIFFNNSLNKNIISTSLSSLFGVSNIYQIIKKMSYFERTGEMFPLLHTWTLSIEIQFYIFYPILIYFLKKLKKKNETNILILILCSLISAGVMFYKSYNNYGINEIYYGTDTRIFSLFIGGATYFYSQSKFKDFFDESKLKYMAIFSSIIIFLSMILVGYEMKINYYGLLYVLSILGGVIILATMKTDFLNYENKLTTFFSNLGKRSYSYYMWQYPIMIFSLEYFKWSDIDYGKTVLIQIFILILFAELSYFLFEKKEKRAKLSGLGAGLIYFLLLFFSPLQREVSAEEIIPENSEVIKEEIKIDPENKTEIKNKISEKTEKQKEIGNQDMFVLDSMEERLLEEIGNPIEVSPKIKIEKEKIKQEKAKVIPKEEPKIKVETQKEIAKKEKVKIEKIKKEGIKKVEKQKEKKIEKEVEKKVTKEENTESSKNIAVNGSKYTFIGDSVMKGSEKILLKKFKGSYVDAKVSRQFTELPKILKRVKQGNKLNEIVVIHLGTNGAISKKSFDESMQMLKDKQVYFINCVVPKRWEKPINKDIKEWSAEHKNIKVIDWYSVAKGKRKLFSKDATHPSVAGRKVYTKLIFDNVK